jgi:hypothetical protein
MALSRHRQKRSPLNQDRQVRESILDKRTRKQQRREARINRFKDYSDMTTSSAHSTTTYSSVPVVKGATATPLIPHAHDTKHQVIPFQCEQTPMFSFVGVTPTALEKMSQYIRMCSEEISWLGTVRVEGNAVIIDEVYLFEQEVSAAQTDLDEHAMVAFASEMMERDMDEAMDVLPRLRMWGHSHVNMEVNPSGTDDTTMKKFAPDIANTSMPFMLRLIANKRGKMKIDIYYYQKSLATMDVPWGVVNDADDMSDEIYQEMMSKVKRRSYTSTSNANYSRPSQQNQSNVSRLPATTPNASSTTGTKSNVDNKTNTPDVKSDRAPEDVQDFYKRLKEQGYSVDDEIERMIQH